MARRTQFFQQIPWTGGINTAVDPGLIPANDLQIAENVVFGSSGSRLRREGWSYLDAESAIPAVTHRSSSGTTRTLVFASSVYESGPANHRLVTGEKISVTSTGSGNDLQYQTTEGTISSITTTSVTNDTISYTFAGASSLAEGSTSTGTLTVERATEVLDINDYWRDDASNVRVQLLVAVTNQPKFFKYDSSGRREEITNGGTALTGPATQVTSLVMNNNLIMAFSRTGDTPKKYKPEDSTDVEDLGGSPPDFSIMRIHQRRLWTNDKTNKDRLHYSSPDNAEEWQGVGDSGALDIDPGDGDEVGITAIFPSFKGSIFVAKGTKLYEVVGDSPENYTVQPVTRGLGAVSHKAVVPVDLDDVVFTSYRGVHSLQATAAHGDFEANYLSTKIQPTFNDLDQSKLSKCQAAWLPHLNSVAFALTEEDSTGNNTIYFFNAQIKEWYEWPDIQARALALRRTTTTFIPQLVIGNNKGRIITTQNGTFTDFGSSGTSFRIKTGTIYPDGNPTTMKAFKRIGFLFKPKGTFQFTVSVKIDNLPVQSLAFEQTSSGDLLGSTFVLGSSVLGIDNAFAPFFQPIDGLGRGCTVEVIQSSAGEQVELYGFIIEFEPADFSQEVDE